jgi:phosphate starvation-inducible protein PhoH and related proteins
MAKKDHSEKKKSDKSKYVHQGDKLNWVLNIRERTDLTDKQKELIDIITDKKTRVVFINGPAGTSKTFLAVYCGLLLLNSKSISNITYVRTIIESASKSLGSLPGDSAEKMEPYLMPLMDKLEEFIPVGDAKKLNSEGRIKGIPVNYLRGASLNAQYIIADEAQNFTFKELLTTLTRLGEYSKLIVLLDPDQSDINGKSGALPMFDLFNDESSKENGVHCFSFTKDDIVRSGILKFILEKVEGFRNTDTFKSLK